MKYALSFLLLLALAGTTVRSDPTMCLDVFDVPFLLNFGLLDVNGDQEVGLEEIYEAEAYDMLPTEISDLDDFEVYNKFTHHDYRGTEGSLDLLEWTGFWMNITSGV
ncbi:uncharacterized protein [Apostichopus japonicus]|uniref:uncharacterized protein n=1 Tax=Stichopus japonicus TaxID=307972 RepID=UPI003AB6BE5E